MPYQLATVHPLQTDRETDRQTTTMTIAQPLLKYGRLKIFHTLFLFTYLAHTWSTSSGFTLYWRVPYATSLIWASSFCAKHHGCAL